MAGISLRVVSTQRPQPGPSTEEPSPPESSLMPRSSYYDFEVPHELMKNSIPTRPNRLLHDQGQKRMEKFLKRMERAPDVLEKEVQRRRRENEKAKADCSWWQIWRGWSSSLDLKSRDEFSGVKVYKPEKSTKENGWDGWKVPF